jgi:hypothetical protein
MQPRIDAIISRAPFRFVHRVFSEQDGSEEGDLSNR